MRNLLVVLSAAVIAGLGVYFAFTCIFRLSLVGDDVSLHVNTFVMLVACLCLTAAGMALLLHTALVRTDRKQFQVLERRIAQLEQGRPAAM